MELPEFIAQVPNFESLSPREKIQLFAWYLHVHGGIEAFGNAEIRDCFKNVSAREPLLARDLPRMADRRLPDLLRVRDRYKLEGALKRSLDGKYGVHPSVIFVTKLLAELPTKIPDLAERAVLSEALDCYRVRAYRAAIVMVWNLTFDHLVRWIMVNPKRLADFNAAVRVKYPKKDSLLVQKREDFDHLKEFETIEICRTADLLSKNITEILRERLKRRNIAAHPSQIVILQSQADDLITDLINNVVLPLGP